VAFVAEQIPLILWAMGRQRPFSRYEDALAKLTLTVGSKHLANNYVSSSVLEAAAADPGLVLRWPDMYPDLPGPDRDNADQWLLDNGMTSRTQILMRREHLSREEAEARIVETAEDLKTENEVLSAAAPAPEAPKKAKEQELDDDENDDEETDLEDDDDETDPDQAEDDDDEA
jgi:hypothetical protein